MTSLTETGTCPEPNMKACQAKLLTEIQIVTRLINRNPFNLRRRKDENANLS